MYNWLLINYGNYIGELTTQGIIILDTLMEYNTTNNSQDLPEEIDVSYLINV
jgi:hypothetical protein